MAKKGARRVKDNDTRQAIISIRRNLKENLLGVDIQRRQLGGYIKLGQDLYITCNNWLFTGDTKTDTVKLTNAVEALLLCRKYTAGILMAYQSLVITASEIKVYLQELKNTGDISVITDKWMSVTVPRVTAVGEGVALACLELKPVLEQYGETIKQCSEVLHTNVSRAIKDAEDNIELMRASNMNNITPEEEAEATRLMEEALAESESKAAADPTIPTMEADQVSAPATEAAQEVNPDDAASACDTESKPEEQA